VVTTVGELQSHAFSHTPQDPERLARLENALRQLTGPTSPKCLIFDRSPQGRPNSGARYRGVRRNLFDLRRASAIQNLEAIQRKVA